MAISSAGGFTAIDSGNNSFSVFENQKSDTDFVSRKQAFPGWEIYFDDTDSRLMIGRGPLKMTGRIDLVSGNDRWILSKSRDGIPERYAIVDKQGNVQGYLIMNAEGNRLALQFYHRTAQAYEGILSYEGEISFHEDSYACHTKPSENERVLSLTIGAADSRLNDSLFSPLSDIALRLTAASLELKTLGKGLFAFKFSGRIDKAGEAVFIINLEKDFFRNRYVPYYSPLNRERCPKAPTGWMSWNTYFDKATAEDNLAEARTGKKFLQPFGCEFWSIESWQGNSDQLPVRDFYNMDLEVNEKQFPKGMKQLADDIRTLGFRPGLWMAPFGTGNRDFYESHRDWFLHDKQRNPISCWNGRYTLDPTVQEARDHLKEIFRTASREWGYEFFKIDGMSGRSHSYCAHLYERPEIKACFRDPDCPNSFELCVRAFREGMGEDRVFLACQGHTSGAEALYADASRIGADIVHPNQPVKWSNVLNQGSCTINQVFTHNIVMINDPDTLLVRDLPLEEARVTTTVVSLPGQMTFFGDKLAGLPGDRMKMLQQTLPVAHVMPLNLYPVFSMLPVWNLHINNELIGNYNVVALFNWNDEDGKIYFTSSELGVDQDAEYSLFEFWTQKSYGIFREKFETEVPAHGIRLFAMHKVKPHPQWVSSDRHVVQNGTELISYKWNPQSRIVEGKIRLTGTFPLTMYLRVPDGFTAAGVKCAGAECSLKRDDGNITAVSFYSENTGDFDFQVKF